MPVLQSSNQRLLLFNKREKLEGKKKKQRRRRKAEKGNRERKREKETAFTGLSYYDVIAISWFVAFQGRRLKC